MYEAVCHAMESISTEGVQLVDYTATEDACVPQLPDLGYHTKKHYVLFIELEAKDGQDVMLTPHDKAKVPMSYSFFSILNKIYIEM